jgi:hypothetical protein
MFQVTGLPLGHPKMVVLPKAFHRLRRCRLFHLLAFVNKFTTLANKKASPTSLERLCARDWIRTSTTLRMLRPEHSASTNFATRAVDFPKSFQEIIRSYRHFFRNNGLQI